MIDGSLLRSRLTAWLSLVAASLLSGCRTGRNYPDLDGPRYVGTGSVTRRVSDTITVVTFNIAFGRNIDRAITLLGSDPELARADILLLQEMNAEATQRIAVALGMSYVYYPAINHGRTKQDFGNAVLAARPIVGDAKVILPHPSRYATTQRTATVATIRIGDDSIRVYSTHLGTMLDVSGSDRREQLQAILADATRFPRVIVGGDFNASDIGSIARDAGYAWPTERGERTTLGGRWDHVLLKGLVPPDSAASGTAVDSGDISDHRPVWARPVIRE